MTAAITVPPIHTAFIAMLTGVMDMTEIAGVTEERLHTPLTHQDHRIPLIRRTINMHPACVETAWAVGSDPMAVRV